MFTVYTRTEPPCSYCKNVKALLERKGLSYTEIELTKDNLAEFSEKTKGARTVPQVFYNETLIGGFEQTLEFVELWWNDKDAS